VVPFENSTNGSVVVTLDNFADRANMYPDLSVCGEIYLDVHHCLVGRKGPPTFNLEETAGDGSGACTPTASDPNPLKPRTKPLSSLKHIQRLYSHPQAWGQCNAFLSTYLRGVESIDVSSTSKAAELVSNDETGTSAAVSSELSGSLHGLDILAKSIEDREDNTTRFFIIRKGLDAKVPPFGPNGAIATEDSNAPPPPTKSLVSFSVPHHSPGALADVLECFRKCKLNLTSINSRPSLVNAFQYVFFVEFEGHRFQDTDGRVSEVLGSLGKVAESWRWLGSWVNQRC
jgi:prephenate dehydratase